MKRPKKDNQSFSDPSVTYGKSTLERKAGKHAATPEDVPGPGPETGEENGMGFGDYGDRE